MVFRHQTPPSTSDADQFSSPARRPRSRVLVAFAAMLAVLLGSGLLTSCESTPADRAAVLNAVNASRAANGLAPVVENGILDLKADKWAQHMRDVCNISHSTLREGAPPNWRKLGENVGRGGTIEIIHDAYMNSPGHRANILDPAFNQMGVAAVWGDCDGMRTVFTVHVFMKA